MRTRTSLAVFAMAVLVNASSWAQTQPLHKTGPSPAIRIAALPTTLVSTLATALPTTLVTQAPDEDSAKELVDQLKRMELRLRELELDVERRLHSQPELAEQQKDSHASLNQRFADLESSVHRQGEAVEQLNETIPGLVHHGHHSPKITFFGRIHTDYWAFPKFDNTLAPLEGGSDPEDRFNFRRLRIGVKGDINDNMFYKYEGEFAGGNNPSYRDAYLGFRNLPWLNTVTIGNHKRPYGLDHLNSSRYNVFTERPFIVEAFNQDSRRLGISSSGYSENEKANWRFGVWNQQLTQGQAGYTGDHYQLEFAARLATTAWYDESSGGRGYAHFGISGSAGTPNGSVGSTNNQARYRTRPEARSSNRWLDTGPISGANANYLIGLESVINVGSFQLTTEYMRNNVDRRDAVGEDVAFEGGYAQVSYFLTGEYIPWNRKTGTIGRIKPLENFFLVRDCDCDTQSGWGAWQVAARYSYADLSDADIFGGEAQSMTFGLNWYWNQYARMQFNYILGDIEQGGAGYGNYEILGVRLMVDF